MDRHRTRASVRRAHSQRATQRPSFPAANAIRAVRTAPTDTPLAALHLGHQPFARRAATSAAVRPAQRKPVARGRLPRIRISRDVAARAELSTAGTGHRTETWCGNGVFGPDWVRRIPRAQRRRCESSPVIAVGERCERSVPPGASARCRSKRAPDASVLPSRRHCAAPPALWASR